MSNFKWDDLVSVDLIHRTEELREHIDEDRSIVTWWSEEDEFEDGNVMISHGDWLS